MLALGLNFLGHHDTEYGHIPLLAALGAGVLAGVGSDACDRAERTDRQVGRGRRGAVRAILAVCLGHALRQRFWRRRFRSIRRIARSPLVRGLISRCRFAAVPADDVERLALWCRDHTPATARFIGPPGPKTFRLWSQRSLAFNRSASPYHAAGLADWFARFQDHVDFHGPAEDVRAGLRGRSPRLRSALRSTERRRAGGPRLAPGCGLRRRAAPERSNGEATNALDGSTARSSCCTSKGATPSIG